MKLVFATDLHGSAKLYEQLRQLVAAERPRALVLGGDMFHNQKPWREDALRQRAFIEGEMTAWLERLHEGATELDVFAVPGNHDWRYAIDAYEGLASRGLLRSLHLAATSIDGVGFSGYGCTPPSVFPTKDYERWDTVPGESRTGCGKKGYITHPEKADETKAVDFKRQLSSCGTMAEELATLPEAPGSTQVFISHSPPWDSLLDRMWGDRPIGSFAVRDHIAARAPTVSLHGHVHESPEVSGHWWQELGATLSINPGRTTAQLAAAILDVENPRASLRHTLLE